MPNLEPDIEKESLYYPEDLLFVRSRKSALKLTFSMISLRVSIDFPCPGNDSMCKELRGSPDSLIWCRCRL